jgi:predicted peptidase
MRSSSRVGRACGAAIATLFVVLSLAASASAAGPITPGATFNTVGNLGVTGSQTYVYTPSVLISPTPMLTPVLFVYSNSGYASKDAAWDAISTLGMDALAEQEHAIIIVQNPVAGGAWSASDVTVYQGVLDYIFGGNTAASGKPALSYYRMDYMLGEGNGATFINQYMTQSPNVNRIAGVATFGGTWPAVTPSSALPAYIVGAPAAVVSAYKAANGVDTSTSPAPASGETTYNAANPAKRVIVSGATNTAFDKALIADAYTTLFRTTVRQGLSTPVFYTPTTTEDFTLMQRPNLQALDLTQNLVSGAGTGTTGQTRWYEWVPNEVLAGMQSGSTKKYPLVIDLHGRGDHEIYEAESNGWISLAGNKKVIVVAPFDETVTTVMNLIAAIEAKYPVDTSRVYMTGFSMGASNTWLVSSNFPSTFAAIAPMSSPSAAPVASLATWNDKIDLPTYFSANTNEMDAVQRANGTTIPVPQLKAANLNALNTYMRLNNIAIPPNNATPQTSNDFKTYPIYGFPYDNLKNIPTQYGFTVTTGTLSNAYGIPLMELAIGQNLDHTHYMPFAEIAWDFMSKYTRDTVTGATHYAMNTSTTGTVGGTVAATLSLSLGTAGAFGPFTPGLDKSYDASTTATVISTAGDATLSISDPSTTATGRLVNGIFALSEPLQAKVNAGTFAPLSTTAGTPLTLLTYANPVSNDPVTIGFRQHIAATQALRTGAYSKTLTFTLSTTAP